MLNTKLSNIYVFFFFFCLAILIKKNHAQWRWQNRWRCKFSSHRPKVNYPWSLSVSRQWNHLCNQLTLTKSRWTFVNAPKTYTLIHTSSSSSYQTTSTDLSDTLPPPVSIDHCFWQVFKTTSCIDTELLYVGSSWSSCFARPCEGVH